MKNTLLFRVSFVALACAAGCYETSSLRVPVRSASSPAGCVDLADQVFFDAGFSKLSGSTGAMVYTPRGPAGATSLVTPSLSAFNWGIGVWKPDRATWSDTPGACEYELQALSTDPSCAPQCPSGPPLVAAGDLGHQPNGQTSCAIQCPMTPQPGAQFDQATREMAARLRAAGGTVAARPDEAPPMTVEATATAHAQ